MEILAHGLWANAIFEGIAQAKKRERSKKEVWLTVFFGIAPDLFSFGLLFVSKILRSSFLLPYARARFQEEWGRGLAAISENWLSGTPTVPDPASIPQYVNALYGVTHSLLIFAVVFGIIWAIRRRPYLPFAAWGLHIGLDVFSHAEKFFPTPIFFPISDFHVGAVSWADPTFMAINYFLLILTYLWLYRFSPRRPTAVQTANV
ncbi:hypothetical protein C4587_00030 [Candidatus Parcubacteria bacterium]|nr:MAG: hypothetical protein C4587_00030 [Candidatus Parcubacteria bacterium]